MGFTYEVRLGGRLTRTLQAEFEELGLAAKDQPAETVLHGPVVDQAALHGLLRRVEALGLELVELRRLPVPAEPAERGEPRSYAATDQTGQTDWRDRSDRTER
jgi:hypothetical protein